jgi:hypothetical protein
MNTINSVSQPRCLVVGLTEAQAAACATAVRPIEVVRTTSVKDACDRMASLLPLVVIVDFGLPEGERNDVAELATACGAEIVSIEGTPERVALAKVLLEALGAAEKRRSR